MFKLLKDSFNITNDCIILATPLAIFLTLLGLYYNYADEVAETVFMQLFSAVTIFIIISGFLSAWLYMTKKAIAMSKRIYVFDEDRTNALLEVIASLSKGFGRLFLPIIGMLALCIIIYSLTFSIIAYLPQLPILEDYTIYLLILIFIIISFSTILWLPEIVYHERNALFALYNSVLKTYTYFKQTLFLYITILLIFIGISLSYYLIFLHPILSFFVLIIFYYILVYIVVLLFTYYERTFITDNKK